MALGSTAKETASADGQTDLSALLTPSVITDSKTEENDLARQEIADLMAQHKSDFVIHTGNITDSGLDEDANEQFFTPFKEVLRHTPLFIAVGPNEYGPNRAGDIPHSLACIDKAKTLLGYAPEFSVKRGLQAAAEWYFKKQRFV